MLEKSLLYLYCLGPTNTGCFISIGILIDVYRIQAKSIR